MLNLLRFTAVVCMALCSLGAVAAPDACQESASPACYRSFEVPKAGGLVHYFASLAPSSTATAAPLKALIALHGYSHDASKTFNASLLAVRKANAMESTLVVAPVFQVLAGEAGKCGKAAGLPAAQTGDLLWTCQSWMEGGRAANGSQPTSFAVMDALVTELSARWPSLRTVTIAGFSAGGQTVQHYVGFAQERAPGAVALRYVVADPGSWLYFDTVRPQPMRDGKAVDWDACGSGAESLRNCTFTMGAAAALCPGVNRWKYGTDGLPAELGRLAAEARRKYVEADVSYLEGDLDSGTGTGTAYRLLDKSCGAQAQGPYRMQRGLAYAAYDRAMLAPEKRRVAVIVPGCAHDVACVFPAEAARGVLLGP